VLLRARRRAQGTPVALSGLQGVRESAERAIQDIGRETRRLLGDR